MTTNPSKGVEVEIVEVMPWAIAALAFVVGALIVLSIIYVIGSRDNAGNNDPN